MVENLSSVAPDILSAGIDAAKEAMSSSPSSNNNRLVDVGILDSSNAVSIVASILNEATAVINIVVGDATGVLGSVVGIPGATSVNAGGLTVSSGALLSSGAGSNVVTTLGLGGYQGSTTNLFSTAVPGSANGLTSSFSFNASTLVSNSMPTSLPAYPVTPACPALNTITPICPGPVTVTCYTTETWHSTYYESSITLYSLYTVTET